MTIDTYKDEEWCKENFRNYLEANEVTTSRDYTLKQLTENFTDHWSDFCVLEGIDGAALHERMKS